MFEVEDVRTKTPKKNLSESGFVTKLESLSNDQFYLEKSLSYPSKAMPTWRIIPVSEGLVTPNYKGIYKPFRPFGRGITPVRGLTNHGY